MGHQWGDLWGPMRPHAYVVHLAANAPCSIVFEVAPPVSERIVKVEFQVEFLEVVHIVFAGDTCTCRSCVRDAGIGGAELQREGNASYEYARIMHSTRVSDLARRFCTFSE